MRDESKTLQAAVAKSRDGTATAVVRPATGLDTSGWTWCDGRWDGAAFTPRLPDAVPAGGFVVATSPVMTLEAGQLNVVTFEMRVRPAEALYRWQVVPLDAAVPGRTGERRALALRDMHAAASERTALTFAAAQAGRYVLQLCVLGLWSDGRAIGGRPEGMAFARPAIGHETFASQPSPEEPDAEPEAATELAHWNRLERWVHARCKASRNVNTLVSAIETRIGREELLSLPQYMSLCPTGQCNATCAFCSVTIGRTGILKKQLPLADIQRFSAPARRTVRMWGLEGNGEPTLYKEFDRLAAHVMSQGATAYLITNASQFKPALLPLLLGLTSINISLNAATADTHQRVMGLRNFADIADGIRALLRMRGPGAQNPQVSVSFVVTRDNVFEAVAFLRMAEFDLKVDRILLRPLSELGNDAGTVEDLRDLVPYQSEIDDLIEGVHEHLAATAGQRRAEIVFEPETFKAVRPDPPGTGILPLDRPDELPAPRRGQWHAVDNRTDLRWHDGGRFAASRAALDIGGVILTSDPIPVPTGRTLSLSARLSGAASDLEVRAVDLTGRVLAAETVRVAADAQGRSVHLAVPTTQAHAVVLELRHGPAAFDVEVDLGRVRRPASLADPYPAVPVAARWEGGAPGAASTWAGTTQTIRWDGPAGPYLAKSYSRPCLPGVTLSYPVRITVTEGTLGIGVLSQDFQSWVKTFTFEAGRHDTTLSIDVGRNARMQLVVFAAGHGRLAAQIDWRDAMQPQPVSREELERLTRASQALMAHDDAAAAGSAPIDARLARRQAMAAAKAAAAPVAVGAPPAGPSGRARPRRGGRLWRLLHDPRTIHCHKPWTDLHNFTVDGRMDVCCIATGSSQQRFALGNLSTQSFQEVWNGAVAREFRRTVNEPDKALPPCQRCPMARAYAGPLFNPDGTFFSVWSRVQRLPVARVRIGRYALFALFLLIYGPVHLWLFRGYLRDRLFPDFKKLKGGR